MYQYGCDMPTTHDDQFPPVIRRSIQPREAMYCELGYALPRVGIEGILGAVWQDAQTGQWRCNKFLVAVGAMPPVHELGDVPVWLVLLLADFVGAVALALRHERPQRKAKE